MNTSPEYPQIPTQSTHVLGDTDNPYARKYCRSRKITPTMCNGVCGDCKMERKGYKTRWIGDQIMRMEMENGGDPDADIPDRSSRNSIIERKWKDYISRIDFMKQAHFATLHGSSPSSPVSQ